MPLVVVLVVLWAVSSILFIVGWRVSITGAVLLVSIIFSIALDQQAYSNHLYLMAWLVLLLTIADAGAALSIGEEERPVVRWPVLLVMAQGSIVYGFSAITKLNEGFLSGNVLAGVLSNGPVAFPEILRTPVFLSSLALVVVVVELFVSMFLWSTRYRPAAFVLGLALHVSIILLMQPTAELIVFSLEMLALYPLFLEGHPLLVVYDDDCSFCIGWISRFESLDLLDVVSSVAKKDADHGLPLEEVEKSLHVIHHEEMTSGFRAVTRVLEHLVPTLWLAPLLRLPGLSSAGERWYAWQAKRRSCRMSQAVETGA